MFWRCWCRSLYTHKTMTIAAIAIDDHRQDMRHVLPPEDQPHFDSYYSRWIDYRRDNNHEQVESMEKRMRHVMSRNHIPPAVPFDEIASYGERDHDRDRDRDRDHQ